ncbi:MAG: RDD family protein [Candidatus Obscuribacterales bacterium]|nr:RDD family protein [Candidatus Obscuribacterales bacterium]
MKNQSTRDTSGRGSLDESQYQKSSLAEQILNKKVAGTDKQSGRKTVTDVPAIGDAMPTRRMNLDPNQSYGMQVKRPLQSTTGEYQVLTAPTVPGVLVEQKPILVCEQCGTTSKEMRLTCQVCGSYFNSDVTQTSWDLKRVKVKARTTQTMQIPPAQEKLEWRHMLMRRLAAKSIDLLLVSAVFSATGFSYFQYVQRSVAQNPTVESLFANITFYVLPVVALIVVLIYNAFFECGTGQATPGKICMHIGVANFKGECLSLLESIWRSFVNLVPLMLVAVSAWLSRLFNPGLASMPTETDFYTSQTIAIVSLFAFFLYGLSLYFMSANKKMQTLGDVITDTIVDAR